MGTDYNKKTGTYKLGPEVPANLRLVHVYNIIHKEPREINIISIEKKWIHKLGFSAEGTGLHCLSLY